MLSTLGVYLQMEDGSHIRIAPIKSEDVETVRCLFKEYMDSLGVDLSFQEVTKELIDLPGKYAPPLGCIFLAWDEEAPVGCVALRPLDSSTTSTCEMKRLYVRPQARGKDLGRRLAETTIAYAKSTNIYSRMVLDTLTSMHSARKLYTSLGFYETPPYYSNPLPGTLYLALDL